MLHQEQIHADKLAVPN